VTAHPRIRPGDDRGTVLVLLLGFTAVLLLMVTVVVNVSAVILAKRALASAADGAAVSAAQALDLDALYAGGLRAGRIPLDEAQARDRVASYAAQAAHSQPGLALAVTVSPDGSTAVVRARRSLALPFGRLLGFAPVLVEAEARARAPVTP
jgi:Flp pilus assembly protein TadG